MLRRGLERMSLEEDGVIEDNDQLGVNYIEMRCSLFGVINREPEQESGTWTGRSRVKCTRVREKTDKRRLRKKEIFMPS